MKQLVLALLAAVGVLANAQEAAVAMEQQVAEITAGSHVTIVHFWAPWCGNCKTEMQSGGWAKFIAANPNVKFVFLNIMHRGQDPWPMLMAGELGGQPNLLLLTHPNPSSKADDKLKQFLGLPITWIPTTWVFRAGKLRFALNYGEARWPILQQFVDDSHDPWNR